MPSDLDNRILKAADSLEALAFFVQDLNDNLVSNLANTRTKLDLIPRQKRRSILKALEADIKALRRDYGAIESDSWFRQIFAEARSKTEYIYISKLHVDQKMFRFYEKVFSRWPHIKQHALVVFDAQANSTTSQIYEVEGALYGDAKLVLDHARKMHGGIKDFRRRSRESQIRLFSYLRSATMAVFSFLEAYLNGLAYDCFHLHHQRLSVKDHDLLAEWDSQQQRRRFVAFHEKIFRYPKVVGRMYGKSLDLSGFQAAQRIADKGKLLRDALAHPSPFVDLRGRTPGKLPLVMTLEIGFIEELYRDSGEYVETVERGIGNDPRQSCPWLYR